MGKRRLYQDLCIILASVALAWAIVRFDAVPLLLAQLGDAALLATLVAGAFFTSIVTTAPAMAILGELALQGHHPFLTALVGAVGAVCGDYLIFAFVRDRVSDDIAYLIQRTGTPRVFKVFRRKTFRRLLPFIGALIIASPLPDELGLALLGLSHTKTGRFILISFVFNALGILLICLAAQSLAG